MITAIVSQLNGAGNSTAYYTFVSLVSIKNVNAIVISDALMIKYKNLQFSLYTVIKNKFNNEVYKIC